MPHGNSNGNTSWCPGCPGCPYLLALFLHLLDKMIQAKSADVCGLPKSPVISVARNQKLNENESKEPQETTYVSAGDMLTAPWPCQVRTAPSTPSSSSTRAVALAFHGQLPTPSSTLCHTVPLCLTELGICSTSCHPFSGGPWPLGLARPQAHSARILSERNSVLHQALVLSDYRIAYLQTQDPGK